MRRYIAVIFETAGAVVMGHDATIYENLYTNSGLILAHLAQFTGSLVMALYTGNMAAFMTIRSVLRT